MTLRHLRIFLTVCQEGSATAAAEKLYIAQPTVSVALRELEGHYGVTLFDRIGRRLRLTDAGEQMRSYAQHIVSLLEEMEERAQDWEECGTLRLGSSITIGAVQLPKIAGKLQGLYPNLRIEVTVGNSDTIESAILQGELDLGLVGGISRTEKLSSIPLGGDELVFLCRPGHPLAGERVSPCQVELEPFLLRERGSASRDLVESALKSSGVEIRPLWQSISNEALISAAEEGLGLTALPRPLAQPAIEAGRLCQFWIEGVCCPVGFSLLFHRGKYLTRPMRELIRLCQEEGGFATG